MNEVRSLSDLLKVGAGAGGKPLIRGYASVFNEWTTLYERDGLVVREVIRDTAFNRALKERHDVRALFNHDSNLILGRTTSGTLRLSVDSTGLHYEIDPDERQSYVADLLRSLKRGDVSQSSFGFIIPKGGERVTRKEEAGGKRVVEREIIDTNLLDVSPVAFPAYTGTSVGVRGKTFGACSFVESILKSENRDFDPSSLAAGVYRRTTDRERRMRYALARLRLGEHV